MEELQMKVVIVLMLMIPSLAWTQDEPAPVADPGPAERVAACSSEPYHQFDFWIGNWDVSSDGQPAGTNSIHQINGGCALQENWQGAGPGGLSGTSFNIYDQANDKWHQTWVDSSGTLLQLNGAAVDGKMILSGERPKRDGSGMAKHRITWTPNDDGSVQQYWEASSDNGATWNVLFDGLYVRQSEDL
jgi:hypothetical protein